MAERTQHEPRPDSPSPDLERQVAGLKPGDHLCLIYDTPDEQFAAAIPFVRDGLARGQRCLYAVDERRPDEVLAALEAAGVDAQGEIRRGALVMLTKRDAYLQTGTFDPARMIGVLRHATEQAIEDGCTGLRATGEMTWALGFEPGVERLIEYEAKVNAFFRGRPALALCQYNRRRFSPDIIHEVLRTHPIAIIRDRVCPNLYYEEPAAVLGRPSEAKRVAWMIGQLRRATDADAALRRSEISLREAQSLAHIGSWELDLVTNRLTWSDEIYRIFELDPGAFGATYEAFLGAVHPDDRAMVDRAYTDSVANRIPYEVVHRLLLAGGRVKYVLERCETTYDRQDRPIRSLGTVQDITERELAQEAVRKSERKYREIFSHVSDALLLLDVAAGGRFRVADVNPATERMFGISAADAVGRPLEEVAPPRVAAHSFPEFHRSVATGEPARYEVRYPGRGLGPKHLETTLQPIRGRESDVDRLVVLFRDITERRQAELEVLRANRMYRVLSHTNQMILRAQTPRELLEEACRIAVEVGALRMAWAGMLDPTTNVVTPVASHGEVGAYLDGLRISGDGSTEALGPGAIALREGRPAVCHDIATDPGFAAWRDAAQTMGYRSVAAFPLRRGGAVAGLFAVYAGEAGWCTDAQVQLLSEMAEDISFALDHLEQRAERARAETARRASEAEYRALFDEAPYGVYRSTPDGRFLTVNPALVEMLGYASADDVLRLDMGRDLYADRAERERLAREHPEQAEVTWRRRDGTRMKVRLKVRVVLGPDGTPSCYEGFAEDVTDRRALEERLRQSQKMEAVGQLAGGIAHDFNNLLATILNCGELASASLPAEAGPHEDLESIRRAARSGAELTRKLLAFSRVQTLELRPVALGALVTSFAKLARRVVREDVELGVGIEAPDATIQADPSAVDQILMNLTTNARDAMPEGGRILISVQRATLDADHAKRHGWGEAGEYATLTVSDTGCGMSAETLRRLFEPFFTTKPVGQGTGLGMPMVYGLAKQHGGFVQVSSEPGEGTTVRVYFPAVAGGEADLALAAAATVRGGTETILLVEDSEELRAVGMRVLRQHGYAVTGAADGEDALRLLDGMPRPPDLIVSDVVMPRVSGPELLERLRRSGRSSRVLFTSGYPARDVADPSPVGAGVPFLVKPWSGADLLRKVREVLDGVGAT